MTPPDADLAALLSDAAAHRDAATAAETEAITMALARAHGLVARAAERLGLTEYALRRRVAALGLTAELAQLRAETGYSRGKPSARVRALLSQSVDNSVTPPNNVDGTQG